MSTHKHDSQVPSTPGPRTGKSESGRHSLADLQRRRDELSLRRNRVQRMIYILTPLALLTPLLGAVFAYRSYRATQEAFVPLALIVYALMPISLLPSLRLRLRQIESDIQEVDFRIDLQEFDVSQSERRAEKLLGLSDLQLRRYYDLNLSQNSWIFGLGVLCIVLGVGVIGATLYLVIRVNSTYETKVITAILGSIGAILTNFVAAIYLKMNSVASENLAAFHSRLVETHRLLLGNLLASRIGNDEKKWDTLSQLSLHLIEKEKL
jgi:MFS family permease